MRPLVVATSTTPTGICREIAEGKHQRLDYVELAGRLAGDCVDYNTAGSNGPLRWLEGKARLDVRQAIRVARLVQRSRYDLVISMSERVAIPLSCLLDRRVRHVAIAFHPLSPFKLRLMRALRIPHRWDRLIVLTGAEGQALRNTLGLTRDQVVTLRNWVDTHFFRSVGNGTPHTQSEFVLSVGLSQRDYPTLIRALRLLPHVRCEVKAGSTWVRTRAGHEREALPENVRINGPAHPSVLRSWYRESRFVVVPIRKTSQWSAGATAVLEAQAMGKAVIATRTPGMPDYVLDGQTGLLVDGGDPIALAEAVDYLWDNPEEAAEMGRRGRAWMEAEFSLEQWLDRFAEIARAAGEHEHSLGIEQPRSRD